MDLGLAFDDEDLEFVKKKDKEGRAGTYCARMLKPIWFDSVLESHLKGSPCATDLDPEQVPHTFKMSGDYHYHQQNFDKAAEQYLASLDILPHNYVAVRQDITESLCRCYIYSGHTEKSLQLARNLVKELMKEDVAHQRQSLILLCTVCELAERWEECVECLEKLCLMQPYYAHFWNQLGDAYLKLLEHSDSSLINDDESARKYHIKRLTCYIRAKLLHQAVIGTASCFIRLRNVSLIDKLEHKINTIPCSHEEKILATEFTQQEIETQGIDSKDSLEENCLPETVLAESKNNTSHSELFYQRFCSWCPSTTSQEIPNT